MKQRVLAFLSLFTSTGTLVCCALPALMVALGFGASFAGLLNAFPQLIWLSENKGLVFALGGGLMTLAGFLQWRARRLTCPADSQLSAACGTTRDWSIWVYRAALICYGIGATFAYILPLITP